MGSMGGLCSLPSRFTPSSYNRCNLVLQRLYTRTQTLHNIAYFSDLNLQTMQQNLLLIYLLKLIVYHGCYHGIYAHVNKGGHKLAHAGTQIQNWLERIAQMMNGCKTLSN